MKKFLMVFIAVLLMVCCFAVAEECAHNMVVSSKPATCTSAEVITETCTICGFTDSWKGASALPHNYSKTQTSAATCTKAAEYTYTCSMCGDSYVKSEGGLAAHNYSKTQVSAATCTAAAKFTYTCTVCGDSYTQSEGSTLNHNMVLSVKEATCTTPKTYTETCTYCGEVESWTEGTTLNHNHAVEVLSEATCIKAKQMREYCTVCNTTIDIWGEGGLAAHKYEVKLVSAADCLNAEMSQEVCSVCGDAKAAYVSAPAKGHTAKVIPAVAATCTETGLTEGSVCSVCGVVLKAQTTTAALGHDWYKRVVKPTESKRGYTEYSCVVCGEYFRTNYTAKLGAEAVVVDVAKNPYGSIVTDLADVEMPYTTELEEEGKHLCIIAKDIDVLRELHLSLALIEQLKAEGVEEICFVVDGAELVVPFAVLETELVEEIKAAFPATLTGYIFTLDPTAVNAEGVAGCLVKVDMTADIASAEKIVAEDGIEMEITDVVAGMSLLLGETPITVVGGGVYTA